MNQASFRLPSGQIWKNRSEYPEPSPRSLALAAAMGFLGAAGIPFCFWSGASDKVLLIVSVALSILSLGYALYVLRARLLMVILLSMTLLSLSASGVVGVAVILLTLSGISALAFLLSALRRKYLAFLIPLAAIGVLFVLTGNWQFSLLALLPFPAAIAMAICTVKGGGRTSVICCGAGGAVFSLTALAALWIWGFYGNLGPTVIDAVQENLRNAVTEYFFAVRDTTLEQVREQSAEVADQFLTVYSDALVKSVADLLIILLPAIVFFAGALIGYGTQILLMANYRSAGMGQVNTYNAVTFRLSLPAAIIFVVSFFAVGFSEEATLAYNVMLNLFLMLFPGVCLMGLRRLVLSIPPQNPLRGTLPILIAAALCCCTKVMIYGLAAFGVLGAIEMFLHDIAASKAENGEKEP